MRGLIPANPVSGHSRELCLMPLAVTRQVSEPLELVLGGDLVVGIKPEFVAFACDVDPILARRTESLATINTTSRAHFEQALAIRAARAAWRAI